MPQFPRISKEQWLAKVRNDLRGRALTDLDFTVADRAFSPFHHADDHARTYAPVLAPRTVTCGIGVAIEAGEPAATNRLILDQLTKGANVLLLYSDKNNIEEKLDEYLKDVYREIIDVYITDGDRHYGLDYELFAHHDEMPGNELPLVACGRMLARYEAAYTGQQLPAFWLPVNDDYLTNIALLRAFRLCYRQLATAYERREPCRLLADPFTQLDDKYGGMIATTAVTMSAVIGGADAVFVPHGEAADAREETFLRRVALNSMNVLEHEAHLNRVADPAAGSYYLETLTDHLAERIWSAFRQASVSA